MLFLEHRELLGLKGPVPTEEYEIEFGQASVVREGQDVTVAVSSADIHQTLKVCEQLAKDGISVELIDPRPLLH
ncbi:MAG: transketolase C-terminal domain-containing protein [Terriglobia bacterium]